VCGLIDASKDRVLELIDEGAILWCWDVSLNPKAARKRCLRILPACVADYLRGQNCSLEWEDVLRILVPDGPVILATEITRLLNISNTLTYDFAKCKVIVPCSTWRAGPGGQARFPVKAFVKFLKDRRVL